MKSGKSWRKLLALLLALCFALPAAGFAEADVQPSVEELAPAPEPEVEIVEAETEPDLPEPEPATEIAPEPGVEVAEEIEIAPEPEEPSAPEDADEAQSEIADPEADAAEPAEAAPELVEEAPEFVEEAPEIVEEAQPELRVAIAADGALLRAAIERVNLDDTIAPSFAWQRVGLADYANLLALAPEDAEPLWLPIEGADAPELDLSALGEDWAAYVYRCVVELDALRAVATYSAPAPEAVATEELAEEIALDAAPADTQAADGSTCENGGAHKWSEQPVADGANGHHYVCETCGAVSENAPHNLDKASHSCTDCGWECTHPSARVTKSDNKQHRVYCPDCEYEAYENHTFGKSVAMGDSTLGNPCTKCGYRCMHGGKTTSAKATSLTFKNVEVDDCYEGYGIWKDELASISGEQYHLTLTVTATRVTCSDCGAMWMKRNEYGDVIGPDTNPKAATITKVKHSYVNGVCTSCGHVCAHVNEDYEPAYNSQYKCAYCKQTCPHAYFDAGVCETCGYSCKHANTYVGEYPNYDAVLTNRLGDDESALEYSASGNIAIAEDLGGRLVYRYLDGKSHVVQAAVTGEAKYCSLCGDVLEITKQYSDGEQWMHTLAVQAHEFVTRNGKTYCKACGAAPEGQSFCEHENTRESVLGDVEACKGFTQLTGADAAKYHKVEAGASYEYYSYCVDCGVLLNTEVDEYGIPVPLVHTFDSEIAQQAHSFALDPITGRVKCQYCGYEKKVDWCDHPADQLEIKEYYGDGGGEVRYVSAGDKHYRIAGTLYRDVYCEKCDTYIEIANFTRVEKGEPEEHVYADGESGVCLLCGSNYGCAHKNTRDEYVLAVDLGMDEDATYTSVDYDRHQVECPLYAKSYCADCGAYLGIRLADSRVSALRWHEKDKNDKCTLCGYKPPKCPYTNSKGKHAVTAEDLEKMTFLYSYTYDYDGEITTMIADDQGNGTHKAWTKYFECYLCPKCGTTIYKEGDGSDEKLRDATGKKNNKHVLNEYGECIYCGWSSPACTHGADKITEVPIEGDYGGKLAYINTGDPEKHQIQGKNVRVLHYCSECKRYIDGDSNIESEEYRTNFTGAGAHEMEGGACKLCGYKPGMRFAYAAMKLGEGERWVPELDLGELGAPAVTEGAVEFAIDGSAAKIVDFATGEVEAVRAGSATLTATLTLGETKYSASMKINVVAGPSEIELNSREMVMFQGQSAWLSAKLLPAGSYANCAWESGDACVSVDANGRLTAVSAGTAIVTARAGAAQASCEITVEAVPEQGKMEIAFDGGSENEEGELVIGQGETLHARILYDGKELGANGAAFHFDAISDRYASVSRDGSIVSRRAKDAGVGTVPAAGWKIAVSAVAYNGAHVTKQLRILPGPDAFEIVRVVGGKDVAIADGKLTLGVNETVALRADLGAATGSIRWSSSDEAVIAIEGKSLVSCEGIVRASGSAKITATAQNGVKQEISVTAKSAPTALALSSDHALSGGTLRLGVGETATLSAAVSAPSGAASAIEWVYATNRSVDIVEENGALKLTAKKVTSASAPVAILARTYNGVKATCGVEVFAAPATEEDVTLDVRQTLGLGDSAEIKIECANDTAWQPKLALTNNKNSSNKTILSLKGNTITAKNKGTAKLVVTLGSVEIERSITVKAAPTSVSLSLKAQTLTAGDTIEIPASVVTTKSSNIPGAATLKSSASSVVSVTATATGWTLTARKAGSANITAKTYNGKVSTKKKITVEAAPTGVKLSASELALANGETSTLTATLVPSGSRGTVEWECTDTTVQITPNGTKCAVKALADTGSATVTAKVKGTDFTAQATIELKKPVDGADQLTGIEVKGALGVGESCTAKPVFAEGYGGKVSWKIQSAKPKKCVSVTSAGVVKGAKVGSATLVATVNGQSVNTAIAVVSAPTKIAFKSKATTLGVGERFGLTVTLTGYNKQKKASATQDGIYSFTSSKTDVVQVNKASGEMVGLKPGSSKITVKTYNKKSASFTVTVKAALEELSLPTDLRLARGDKIRVKADMHGGYANLDWAESIAQTNQDSGITVTQVKNSNDTIEIKAAAGATAEEVKLSVKPKDADMAKSVAPATATVQIVEPYAVGGLQIEAPAKTVIGVGEQITLHASAADGAYAGTVTWSIAKKYKKYASVNATTGVVKGVAAGTATITATAFNSKSGAKITKTVKITVIPGATKLAFSDGTAAVNMGVGESKTLKVTLSGYKPKSTQKVTRDLTGVYKAAAVAPAGIVEVNDDQLTAAGSIALTALEPGTATITLQTYNNKKVTRKVVVRPAPKAISFASDLRIAAGDTLSVKADLGGGYAALTWPTELGDGFTIKKSANDTAVITAPKTIPEGVTQVTFSVSAQQSIGTAAGTCTIQVAKAPTKTGTTMIASLAKSTIGVGEKTTASVRYDEAHAGSVTWKSSNTKIAKVGSTTGAVTGVKAGTATLTATSTSGKVTATCKVKVVAAPTGISFTNSVSTMFPGEKRDLDVKLSGYTGLDQGERDALYSFSSSNESVIQVMNARTGEIKAVPGAKPGASATITVQTYNATSKDTKRKKSVKITLTEMPTELKLPDELASGLTLDLGQSYPLTITGVRADGSSGDVLLDWTVKPADCARVDNQGLLTTLKPTTTPATVSAQLDGDRRVQFQLTIKAVPVAEGEARNMEFELDKETLGAGETTSATFRFAKGSEALVGDDAKVSVTAINASVTEADGGYTVRAGSTVGKATIVVTAANGAKYRKGFDVVSAPQGIELKSGEQALKDGDTLRLDDGGAMQCTLSATPTGYTGALDGVFEIEKKMKPGADGDLNVTPVADQPGSWTIQASAACKAELSVRSYNGKLARVTVEALPKPTTVDVKAERAELAAGEATKITATLPAGTAWSKGVTLALDAGSESLAEFDAESGTLTIKADSESGTVTVNASLAGETDVIGHCDVTIQKRVTEAEGAVTSASVKFDKAKIGVGETARATLQLDSGYAGVCGAWSVDGAAATVDADTGVVTGAAVGTAKVRACVQYGEEKLYVEGTIEVVKAPETVEVTGLPEGNKMTLSASGTATQEITVALKAGSDECSGSYTVHSSDSSVASVEAKAENPNVWTITAKKAGKALITVRTHNGKVRTIVLTVEAYAAP